jgi:hypothetical protein
MSRKVLDSEPNENIWTKRLNWVKARDASKNKYERRLLVPVILPKINAEIFIVIPLSKIGSKKYVKKVY